jgi:hypothetical protein
VVLDIRDAGWSQRKDKGFRLAIGSFIEEYKNKASDKLAVPLFALILAGPSGAARRGEGQACMQSSNRPSVPHDEDHVDARDCPILILLRVSL